MSGRVTQLRRVVFVEPIEPPGPRKDVVEGRCDVLRRFPEKPGREPKNTAYQLELDPSRPGFVVVRHPTSGIEHLEPLARVLTVVPFDDADAKRVAAEEMAALERATAPSKAATA
jgi:hypothetical protein